MASNYHSRILRESLRDGNHSVVSSTGSQHGTVSPDSTLSNMSFNPDQDDPYSESTRVFEDHSLPKLRDPAKKYKYPFARSRSPELIIDTSALRRSFPNFSQAGSPRDRIDMEKIARLAAQSRNVEPTPTRTPKAETTNQQKLIPTTREQSRRAPSLQKENITPSSYVSGATRTRDGAVRRTLAELHPKVRDESDFSFVSEHLEKNSRFSGTDYTQQSQNTANVQPKSQPLSKAARTASQRAATTKPVNLQKISSSKSQPVKSQDNTTIASSIMHNPTQQSFLLPKNIPEISELVTATFKDGSPVYVQSGAVQSRFSNAGKPLPQQHIAVDGIEVPQDEQDIFFSLQMMQERITQLEGEKSDVQRIANDLDKENYKLREEVKVGRRRSDSAIADTGVDAAKLQDENNNLKLEVEASKRKIQTLELHLTNNTTERDRAISRVAEYNKTIESLKSENIGLKNEVDALRQQGEHVANQREASQQELQQNETSWKSLKANLEHKITVLEDNVAGYEHYIADIRKLYAELEQSSRSSKEEIATLKRHLQNSKDVCGNYLKNHQQKGSEFQGEEDEWKAKTHRLEKALRRVVSLKYEEFLARKKCDINIMNQNPTFTVEAIGIAPNPHQRVDASTVFEDSAFFGRETEGTATTRKDAPKRKGNTTTTSQKNMPPAEEHRSTNKAREDILISTPLPNTTSSVGNGRATPNCLPNNTAAADKAPSNSAMGPKTAFTNEALHAYGFGDFPFEFVHNDDLTRSSNFDSIVGVGVMQELRNDVANAGKMQTADLSALDANFTNKSQLRSPFSDIGDDSLDLSTVVKNISKSTIQQGLRQCNQADSQFDLRLSKNPTRLNKNFSNVPETPLGNNTQRYQQRRRSEGSLDNTGGDNHTAMSSVSERSTVLHKRTRSQNSIIGGASRSGRVSNHCRNNSDNMTSAYIIPDIEAPLSIASKQVRPGRLIEIAACGHGPPYQGVDQCDKCAHAASIVNALDKNNTKLIPVSERMPTAGDNHDEPTLRPSMPPMDALAEVLNSMLAEEREMKKKLYNLECVLNAHDSSQARSKRTVLAAEISSLLAETQKKADQIYFLHDVLEGLKETEEWQGIQD